MSWIQRSLKEAERTWAWIKLIKAKSLTKHRWNNIMILENLIEWKVFNIYINRDPILKCWTLLDNLFKEMKKLKKQELINPLFLIQTFFNEITLASIIWVRHCWRVTWAYKKSKETVSETFQLISINQWTALPQTLLFIPLLNLKILEWQMRITLMKNLRKKLA